jgi:hypothetical protein
MTDDVAGKSSRAADAGTLKGWPHPPPERTFGQRTQRGPTSQKALTTLTLRASALSGGAHGLADVVWQGDAAGSTRLAGPQVSPRVRPSDIGET